MTTCATVNAPSPAGRSQLRNILAAGELALAVVVFSPRRCCCAAFRSCLAVDPGFRTDHLLAGEDRSAGQYLQQARAGGALLHASAGAGGTHSRRHFGRHHQRSAVDAVEVDDPLRGARRAASGRRQLPGDAASLRQPFVLPHAWHWPASREECFEQKDVDDQTGTFIVNEAFARRYLTRPRSRGQPIHDERV